MTITEMFDLSGKTALVTGSSRGIGKAIALAYGRAGAKVVFHGSKPSDKLDAAVEEAEKAGIACEKAICDLSNEAETKAFAAEMKVPDILVLNASMQTYMGFEDFTTEEFDKEYSANVKANFILLQRALPVMKERNFGRIIGISSVNHYRPGLNLAIYASSKSSLMNMMKNIARSYGSFGITANTISPGIIATDRNAKVLSDPKMVENFINWVPTHRIGAADDIAGSALLLAAPCGSYITGIDIPVTGGLHL